MKLSSILLSLRDQPLSTVEMAILALVIERPGLTAPDLLKDEHLKMTRQGISKHISLLTQGDYLASLPDPSHGRRKVLLATAKGKRVYESVAGEPIGWSEDWVKVPDLVPDYATEAELAEANEMLEDELRTKVMIP